jgi:diguanylate cyclase (GGDEF)-like protein
MAPVIVALGIALAATVRAAALQRRVWRIESLSPIDPLTGALCGKHLDRSLTATIERHRRTGEPASLLLVDVDRLTTLNEAFGRAEGDRALRHMVALVLRRLRAIDTVMRPGEDEFGIVLSNANLAAALIVADDLRALIASASLIDGGHLSISVGVSQLQEGENVAAWIADSTSALHLAKRLGRNRVATRQRDRSHGVFAAIAMDRPRSCAR